SPITAIIAAAFPVIVGIVRGDPLRWLQLLGIFIAFVSIFMIATSSGDPSAPRRARDARGAAQPKAQRLLWEAIASGVAIGVFFLTLGIGQRSHGFDGLLAARIGSVACLVLLAFAGRTPMRLPRATMGTVIASGAIDMTANALYVVAAQTGALAVASVLTALYPASTVSLARIVLHER